MTIAYHLLYSNYNMNNEVRISTKYIKIVVFLLVFLIVYTIASTQEYRTLEALTR